MDTLHITLDEPSPLFTQAARAWFDGRPFAYEGRHWSLTLLNIRLKHGAVIGGEIGGELVHVVKPKPKVTGRGRLSTADGIDLGRVDYDLSVDDGGERREAYGSIYADPDVIGDAFNRPDALTLVREDCGHKVKLVVTNVLAANPANRMTAEFRVSGSPGPV